MNKKIIKLLEERLTTAEDELKYHEQRLKKLQKLPVLARNDELNASLSHVVGYLNAVIEENKLFISLCGMTDQEIDEYIEKQQEIETANRKQLEAFFARVTGTSKKDSTDETSNDPGSTG